MKSGGKIRVVISIVIMMFLAYLANRFPYEFYHSFIIQDVDYTGIITGMKEIASSGAFLIAFAFTLVLIKNLMWVYAGVILIAGLILLIPFRLIGLNKKRCIEKLECKIVKYAYIIILTLSFLMGGILTSFSIPMMLLMLFVLNAVWGLLVLVLCVIPLKKHSSNSGSADDRDA